MVFGRVWNQVTTRNSTAARSSRCRRSDTGLLRNPKKESKLSGPRARLIRPAKARRRRSRRRRLRVRTGCRRGRAGSPTTWGSSGGGRDVSRSSGSPRSQESQEEVERAVRLVLIDGVGRVDVLRTDFRADADGRAGPYAVFAMDRVEALLLAAVARVAGVRLKERHGARADEVRVLAELRAGRIAQHAVDAVAEGLVRGELRGGLEIGPVLDRSWLLGDDVGIDALDLLNEIADRHHEVALDREVVQRFDGDSARREMAQERVAGEPGLAVDHHPAASAHSHAAGPAERQRAVD